MLPAGSAPMVRHTYAGQLLTRAQHKVGISLFGLIRDRLVGRLGRHGWCLQTRILKIIGIEAARAWFSHRIRPDRGRRPRAQKFQGGWAAHPSPAAAHSEPSYPRSASLVSLSSLLYSHRKLKLSILRTSELGAGQGEQQRQRSAACRRRLSPSIVAKQGPPHSPLREKATPASVAQPWMDPTSAT